MNEICFDIKGKNIRLSFEEARELKLQLDQLFGENKTVFMSDKNCFCPLIAQPIEIKDTKWDGTEVRWNNSLMTAGNNPF